MASTNFYFTAETPPDSMFTDIQTLNKFEDEQFSLLASIVFKFLAEPNKSSKLIEDLDEFANEQGVGAGPLKNIVKSIITIPNSAIKKNLTPSQIKDDLVLLGLSEDKAEAFSEQFKTNYVSLSRSALGSTLMVNQLVDMEWKFGVTAASSELNKVGNTFLQLKLMVNKGNETVPTNMELSLPQFYSFLHEMEKAKASLEYLS